MEYDRLASELFCSFGKITRYISRQKLEITKGEAFVLQELYKNGPLSPADISTRVFVSLPRVAAILNSLEKKELVVRLFDPVDRRRVIDVITDSGRRAAEKARKRAFHGLKMVLTQLDDQDAEDFVRIVTTIADKIDSGFFDINT